MSQPADLRLVMPFTTAVIDDFRAAFGKEDIDASIKAGLRGIPGFYAKEGGQEIGTRYPLGGCMVSGSDMMLQPLEPKEEDKRKKRWAA